MPRRRAPGPRSPGRRQGSASRTAITDAICSAVSPEKSPMTVNVADCPGRSPAARGRR
jgi:hypothetical protein